MVGVRHGTRWGYQTGCRCERCAEEENAYQRERYAARAEASEAAPLTGVPVPGTWRLQARCRTAPLSLFFPERGDDVCQAKAICAGCPVVDACCAYGLAHADLRGVWGGLSERQRKEMRTRRGAVAS